MCGCVEQTLFKRMSNTQGRTINKVSNLKVQSLFENGVKVAGLMGFVLATLAYSPAAFAEDATVIAPQSGQSTVSTNSDEDKLKASAFVGMRGRTQNDRVQGGQVLGLVSLITVHYPIAKNFESDLVLKLYAESGSAQSFYSDAYSPHSGISLFDFYLTWKPVERTYIKFGAITAREITDMNLRTDILFSDVSMPAISEGWHIVKNENFTLKLVAAQAIPVTDTKSTIPTSKESVPFFNTERILADIKVSDRLSIEPSVAHFSFKDLPGSVASQSWALGNSIIGQKDDAAFRYLFEGIDSQLRFKFKASERVRPSVDLAYLVNLRAPNGLNKAANVSLKSEIDINSDVTLIPKVDFFRAEADASPAFYKQDPWPSFYHTAPVGQGNRQGYSLGTRALIKSSSLTIDGRYEQSIAIDQNSYQSDFWGVLFMVGKAIHIM